MIPLKQSPRRTVTLLPRDGSRDRAIVVKRFHHPGPIGRLFDRARASQELRTMRQLSRAGVRVAPPIGARPANGAWELLTEWVEGSVPLEEVLRGRAAAPAPTALLVRRAGELLARAHDAGLDHPDLHPGNLVGDPLGRVWIVDLRRARIRTRLGSEARRRDLAVMAAAVRERAPATMCGRFLVAYLRALHARAALELGPAGHLALDIEKQARILRREVVRRSVRRWTRRSSVCRPFHQDDLQGFCAAEVDDDRIRALWSGTERALAVHDLSWRRLLACWRSAARLCEHAVASARPLALFRSPRPVAMFAPPECPGGPRSGLSARLSDRGLTLEGPRARTILEDAERQGFLAPLVGTRLADCDG